MSGFEGNNGNSNFMLSESRSSFSLNSEATNTDSILGENGILNPFWLEEKPIPRYANLCVKCGDGLFDAHGILCNLCEFQGCNAFAEENIYENICISCGELYSGKDCEVCVSAAETLKKNKKSSRILSSILGTLKRKTVRSSKPKKLQIIHNVDGYNNVYRTNKSFDLNRICELKRLYSTSDQHIYGKLRHSDEQFPIGPEFTQNVMSSKSYPSLNLFTKPSSVTVEEPASSNNLPDKQTHTLPDSTLEWMTSLRRQKFDYNSVPDTGIWDLKSIPSRYFDSGGYVHENGLSEFADDEIVLNSLLNTDRDCTQMVEEFKCNLMEKQRSKRRAIYMKIEEKLEAPSSNKSPISSLCDTFRRSSRRHGFHEKDSDFVNDLLSAFDAVLSRETVAGDVNAEVPTDNSISHSENDIENGARKETVTKTSKCPRLQFNTQQNHLAQCIVHQYSAIIDQFLSVNNLINLEISSSLNTIVVTYDSGLSSFLKLIDCQSFAFRDSQQLMKYFVKIASGALRGVNRRETRIPNTDRAIEYSTEFMTVQLKEEDIYQPIWKFKTVGSPRESYATDFYDITTYDSSRVEDHGEWETDDEFLFSTKMKKPIGGDEISGKIATNNAESENSSCGKRDSYNSVSIFYSSNKPKLRGIVYNYDKWQFPLLNHSHIGASGCDSRSDAALRVPIRVSHSHKRNINYIRNGPIPAPVKAWKYMLLNGDYYDDEEDLYVSQNEFPSVDQFDFNPPPAATLTLQRFKSVSTDNLLEGRQNKKSIGQLFRNKFQRGVLKLNVRQSKDKKGKFFFKRTDSTSLYLENGIKPKYSIFGAALHDVEMCPLDCTVPRFVSDCIKFIEQRDCIEIDGLYRTSGNKTAIDELKKRLTESYIYDSRILRNEDIHTITGILKLFFRELQTPLIPKEIYMKLPENLGVSSNLAVIKKALLEIPNPSFGTLKFLLKHLTVVAHYSVENRMPATNLAIIWGPCLLYSSNMGHFEIVRMNMLTKVLIENYDAIFGDNERLVN